MDVAVATIESKLRKQTTHKVKVIQDSCTIPSESFQPVEQGLKIRPSAEIDKIREAGQEEVQGSMRIAVRLEQGEEQDLSEADRQHQ